jgi:hypothetical protein
MRKQDITLNGYEETVKAILGHELSLTKKQAQDILQGSQDIISANWWNDISPEKTAQEIRDKDLIGCL